MTSSAADLILTNGKIYTLDAAGTIASAVAVADEQIKAVGSDEQIARLASPRTRRIDLAGAVVLPGIIDSHIHVAALGKVSDSAFLYDARSIAEIIERLREHAGRTSGAIIGRGGNFHESALAEGRLPVASDLDKVATDRAVMIIDVNKTIVNSYVLRGIDAAEVPPGGEVPTDSEGRPLGIFLYAAKKMTPLPGQSDTPTEIPVEEAIRRGLDCCARLGITGVIDASVGADLIATYRALAQRSDLPIRVTALPRRVSSADLAAMGIWPDLAEGRLAFGPIKLFFDGFIMHRTALMYEPYEGRPDNAGHSWIPQQELQEKIEEALDAGWPVAVHTTGDRGMDLVVAALQEAMAATGKPLGRSHLIHCYFPTQRSIEAACRLGLVIAAQPTFIRTWGETVRRFVGPRRAAGFVPLKTLLAAGLTVGASADGPITWPDPWTGIYAAVTRRTEGAGILAPRECITVEQALRMYTVGSAAVAGRENHRGTIEVAKAADLTVVDRDILNADPEQIPATRVLKTIVGGQVVYDADR